MSSHRRAAWTLVELLIVITIIVVIAALAAAFMPRMSSQHRVTDAANTVQGWLIQAKIRAKRDGVPTGIRLFVDPNTPGSVITLLWIQQPDPFAAPKASLTASPAWVPSGGGWQLQWTVAQNDANVDFTNSGLDSLQWLVQPGDYFFFGDEGPFRILSGTINPVGVNSVIWTITQGATATGATPPALLNDPKTGKPYTTGPTMDWKVNRSPRPLFGEPPLNIPGNCVLDTNLSGAGGAGFGSVLTQSPASAIANTPYRAAYDILFTPKGQVLNSPSALSVLWVRADDKQFDRSGTVSLTPQIQAPGGTDDQALVGIRATTGDIAVADVNGSVGAGTPGYTPFYFLIQGR